MAITESFTQLAQTQVPNAATVVYTVPANTQTIIRNMIIVNPSGGSCWVKMWTNAATDANIILPEVTLDAGEWGDDDDAITLEAGDTIRAQAQASTTITLTIHGVELTTI
jgi:hypothetical protein